MKLLKTTWKHIRRSPYQALAAMLTMFLTLFVSGIFFLSTAASVFILQYLESKPQITVFFSDKASDTDIRSVEKTIEVSGKATFIKFVSKDDALVNYRQQTKNDPLLMEMVTADVLPASLEVSASDPEKLIQLEPMLKGAPGVEEVVFQKDVVDTFISWVRAIRIVGGSLALLMAFDSVLIVMIVIAMKIALKKKEVEVLNLVGASPWYIRSPFVLEGGLYGVFGSLAAWAIIMSVVLWFRPVIFTFLKDIPQINTVLSDPLSPLFLAASLGYLALLSLSGFVLGSLGSLVAVGRYLRL